MINDTPKGLPEPNEPSSIYADTLYYKKKPSAFKNNAIYFEVGPEYTFDKRMDVDEVKLHLYNPKMKKPKKFNPRVLDLHYQSRGDRLNTTSVTKPLPYSFERKQLLLNMERNTNKNDNRKVHGFRVVPDNKNFV